MGTRKMGIRKRFLLLLFSAVLLSFVVLSALLFHSMYRVQDNAVESGRSVGEVTPEKVRIVQEADAVFREELAKAGVDAELGQYFAALTNMRSVGVMGDGRTYDYAVCLRAVLTTDFMTAEAAEIPWEVLQRTMVRIINEVKGVNRVLYDLTSKPPGTIELE